MKKYLFATFALLFVASFGLQAQTDDEVMTKDKHKIVIQLASDDTMVHKMVIRQIRNIQRSAPNATVEVVCHAKGLTLLQKSLSKQSSDIHDLKGRGVDFVACENTMRDRGVKKEDLLPESRTVPSGLIEIVIKQDKGWSYVKTGY